MVRAGARMVWCLSMVMLIADCGSSPNKKGTAASQAGAGGTAAGGVSGAGKSASGAVGGVSGSPGNTRSGSSSGGAAANPPLSGTGGAPAATNPSKMPGSDAGSAKDAGAATSADASTSPAGSTGTLPAIQDPAAAGPFTPVETDNIGPNNDYTSIAPKELGQNETKHPILVWSPGAGAYPGIYQTLLNHIASHGIVVISYNSTAQGPELATAMDWIISENTRQDSPYYGKLDTTKIAAGGQSAGSLATFNVAGDARLTTTLHINGGTFDPHAEVKNLVKIALFICGDDPAVAGGDGTWQSDLARPNCDADFMLTTAPVWYGDVIGASHTTIIDNPLGGSMTDDPLKKPFLAACAAWLRWQLAGDETMKAYFLGDDCTFCKQASVWKVQEKNL